MRQRRFSLPLVSPLSTAHGTIDAREGFLLAVGPDTDSTGARGVGEATPLPGWTESLSACARALETFNKDGGRLPSATDTPAARHGLSLAFGDLTARETGVPLAEHLRSEVADADQGQPHDLPASVPVNATIGDGPIEETVEAATRAVHAGYRCLKLKLGARAIAADVDRLEAVRDAVGPAVDLRGDANGAWSREEALDALEKLRHVGLEYVEQPVAAADLTGLAVVCAESEVPVAADEAVASHGVETVLDAEAADLLIVKPMALGGPDRALAVAKQALSADVDAVVTTTIDGVVARTAAVHVAAAVETLRDGSPGSRRAAGLATAGLLAADLAPDPCPVRDGEIAVPSGPGLAGDAFDGELVSGR